MTEGTGRTNVVLTKLSVVGDLLLLQLVFLLLSFGIVTLFPAAFALQRMLPDAIRQDRPSLLRRYWSEFTWAFRRFWLLGLVLYFGGLALAFGLLFWISSSGVLRLLALAALVPMTGMVIGLYLSALAVLPAAGRDLTPRELLRSANLFLLRRSLPIAGGVVALVTWFLLAARLPTIFVIGSGLVPALLAYWISDVPARRPEENSGDVSI